MLFRSPHEHTGAPTGQEETFPHEDYDMPHPSRKHTISDISDLVSYPKRGNHNTPEEEARHTQTTNNSKNIQTADQPSTIQYDKVSLMSLLTFSTVLSKHKLNESLKMPEANLCAGVIPWYWSVSLIPH